MRTGHGEVAITIVVNPCSGITKSFEISLLPSIQWELAGKQLGIFGRGKESEKRAKKGWKGRE